MDARVEVDAAAESGIDAGSDAQQASPCPKLPEEIVGDDEAADALARWVLLRLTLTETAGLPPSP